MNSFRSEHLLLPVQSSFSAHKCRACNERAIGMFTLVAIQKSSTLKLTQNSRRALECACVSDIQLVWFGCKTCIKQQVYEIFQILAKVRANFGAQRRADEKCLIMHLAFGGSFAIQLMSATGMSSLRLRTLFSVVE